MEHPRYPVYVLSKGRADRCLTATFLRDAGIHFWLVVEPQEADAYANSFGRSCVIELPFRDRGSVVPARNFVKRHAKGLGKRHWQLDDNIRGIRTWRGDSRVRCSQPGGALKEVEDFVDRWKNVAIAGFRSMAYADANRAHAVNRQVYCAVLVENDALEWRGMRSEDTDYSLQVLAGGRCTVLWCKHMIEKAATQSMKGGNERLYAGDGKLQMVREIQKRWPGLIGISRRHGIPRMSLGHVWRKFTTPLRPA